MKIETTDKYVKITPDEGMVLTTWNEGDDIVEYNGIKTVYAPLTADISMFREITIEENTKLEEDRDKAVELIRLSELR